MQHTHYVFDVDRIENFDDQCPADATEPDMRFRNPGTDRELSEPETPDFGFVSGTAMNVLLRELCATDEIVLRHESYGGPSNFYLLDGSDPALRPLVVLTAGWEAWRDTLGLTLGDSNSQRLDAKECWAFREVPSLLDQAEAASQLLPDGSARSQVQDIIEALRSLHTTIAGTEGVEWNPDAESSEVRDGVLSDRDEIRDCLETTLLYEDLDDPQGTVALLERVLEHGLALEDTDVFKIEVTQWHDPMSWGALTSSQQTAIAMTVIEEQLDPASLLSCLLMQKHGGTSAEVRSLITLSEIPGLLAPYKQGTS